MLPREASSDTAGAGAGELPCLWLYSSKFSLNCDTGSWYSFISTSFKWDYENWTPTWKGFIIPFPLELLPMYQTGLVVVFPLMNGVEPTSIKIDTRFLSKRNSAKLFLTLLFLSDYLFPNLFLLQQKVPLKPMGVLAVWDTGQDYTGTRDGGSRLFRNNTDPFSERCIPEGKWVMLQILFFSSCRLPSTVNTGLNVYRDKNALSHFIVAGGETCLFLFMCFNLKYGLGNM